MMWVNSLVAKITVNSDDVRVPKTGLTPDKVQTILKLTFGLIGAVAVLIITVGAFRLILARGNPEGLNRARNTIIYAAIGLVVTLAAYSIVTFVVGNI